MRISFDFDNCLSNKECIVNLFNILRNSNNEVYILTSRNPIFENKPLIDFITKHKFNRNNVICFIDEKWKIIKYFNIDLHFDDDFIEIDLINRKLGNKYNKPGVLVNADSSWLSYKKGKKI